MPAPDVAGMLELQLDRYGTNTAMLTFVQSLLYASESSGRSTWVPTYCDALARAAHVIRQTNGPEEAVASLHGYQRFMAARRPPNGSAVAGYA